MSYERAFFKATWRMAVGLYSGFGVGALACWMAITVLALGDLASGVCLLVCLAVFGAVGMLLGVYWGSRHLGVPFWPL